jgi:hypothetical protein
LKIITKWTRDDFQRQRRIEMSAQIILSKEYVSTLSPEFKRELARATGLILAEAGPISPSQLYDGEFEFAEIGLQSARAFLEKCSEKTLLVLQKIVDQGDQFSLRELETAVGVETDVSALRGVWTGLTKRTRTITGDDEAELIDWTKNYETNDYLGRLEPVTLASFKKALSEL